MHKRSGRAASRNALKRGRVGRVTTTSRPSWASAATNSTVSQSVGHVDTVNHAHEQLPSLREACTRLRRLPRLNLAQTMLR